MKTTTSREEMLKAIIEKAMKNGWVPKIQWKLDPLLYEAAILFSHEFARAFWGENKLCQICLQLFPCGYEHADHEPEERESIEYEWQRHLQQAVLSDDPLIYYFERL